MWPDNETTRDYLSYEIHASVIRSLITDPLLSPLTVGLFGDWGGGKSSVIRMLQRDLDPSDNESQASPTERQAYEKVACISFNGWQLEGYDDSRAALLSSILSELSKLERFGPKLKGRVKKLLKSVNWMRFARSVSSAGAAWLTGPAVTWTGPVVNALFDAVDSTPPSGKALEPKQSHTSAGNLGVVREFRRDFSKLLSDSKIERLVVLVDDLDRCMPERLIDNLEAIKLFLNLQNTAFVIAADERIVRQAIALRYRTSALGDNYTPDVDAPVVTDYLEKLIQIPYRIPRLSPDETLTYMNLLYCEKHLDSNELQECIKKHVEDQVNNRYAPLTRDAILASGTTKEQQNQVLSEQLAVCETIVPVVTEILKGNPRQIKRFLNTFELRLTLAEKSHIVNIRREVLAKLMALEYSHPARYRDLYDWQAASDGCPRQLGILEKGTDVDASNDLSQEEKNALKQWEKPELAKWVRLNPPLDNFDLRSYFWLTRDALDATLTDAIAVSPFLQGLVNDLLSDSEARRTAARRRADGLTSSDTNTVAVSLANYIIRNPDEPRGYSELTLLARYSGMYKSEFTRAIMAVKPQSVPPSIVITLDGWWKSADDPMKSSIHDAIEQLAQYTTTNVGRAAIALMKKR